MNEKPGPNRFEMLRNAGQCTLIPAYLVVFPLVYSFIGNWLDEWFQTEFLGITFIFLGVFSGGRQSYFIIKRLKKTF